MSLRKPLLLAALFFLPFICTATAFDEHYGIGTVHIVPYNFFALDFYSHANDASPFDEVNFSKDKKANDLHFQFATSGADTIPSWYRPECFHTTDGEFRIEMFCIEKQNDWCKVMVNPATGLTKWVHLGADVVYYDWTAFFTSFASVAIISGEPKLFSKPSLSAKSDPLLTKMEAGGTQLIQAEKVEGAWMQVRVIKFTYNMEQTSSTEGWIQWHDDANLFLTYDLAVE